jgi:hypothetical protein
VAAIKAWSLASFTYARRGRALSTRGEELAFSLAFLISTEFDQQELTRELGYLCVEIGVESTFIGERHSSVAGWAGAGQYYDVSYQRSFILYLCGISGQETLPQVLLNWFPPPPERQATPPIPYEEDATPLPTDDLDSDVDNEEMAGIDPTGGGDPDQVDAAGALVRLAHGGGIELEGDEDDN